MPTDEFDPTNYPADLLASIHAIVCPNCGFLWDQARMWDAVVGDSGEKLPDLMAEWLADPINQTGDVQ